MMIINGIWWLGIILLVFAVMWGLAMLPVLSDKTSKKMKFSSPLEKEAMNSKLQKLHVQLVQKLPDYQIQIRKNHITITKAKNKLMMITLDKDKEVGMRKLGGVMVLNFHKSPSYQEILEKL